MVKPLTKKQDAFAREVVLNGGHKLEAMKAAGYAWKNYSSRALVTQADKLFNKPIINLRIKDLQAKKDKLAAKTFNIDAGYVLRRLKEIDDLDILDIIKDDLSSFKPLSEWPKSWRTSISSIDMKRIITRMEDGDNIETLIEKIKWPDKVKNLEMIGRHITVKAWDTNNSEESVESIANALSDLMEKLPS